MGGPDSCGQLQCLGQRTMIIQLADHCNEPLTDTATSKATGSLLPKTDASHSPAKIKLPVCAVRVVSRKQCPQITGQSIILHGRTAPCGLRGCKNRTRSVSWPRVVKGVPNHGLVLVLAIGQVFWPPDVVVGGLRFYRDSIYLLFSFVRYPRSSLNGTQPKAATCSELSAI